MVSRVLSRVMFAVALLVALAGLLVVGGLLWLRSPWGTDFVRGQIESRLEAAIQGDVRLGSVEGDVLRGLALRDFAIVGRDGVPLVQASLVRARYSLRPFLDKRIMVEQIRLERPEIRLVRGASGRWNFQEIFARPPREPGPPGWGSFVRVDDIRIEDGLVDVEFAEGGWPVLDWQANEFRDVDGTLDVGIFTRQRNLKRFALRDFSFRLTGPGIDVRDLDGEGILTPDSLALRSVHLETPATELSVDGHLAMGGGDSLAFTIEAPRISLEETRRLFPQVRVDGSAAFEGRLAGPARDPFLEIESARVETGRSVVTGAGRIESLVTGPRLDLDLVADPLAPADVRQYVAAWPIDVPMTGPIELSGPPRQLDVAAQLTSSAGALAVQGAIDIRGTLAYRLVGTSRQLDVGRLLGHPSVDLVLSGRYRIDGSGTSERQLNARVALELERSRIYRWDVISGATSGRLVGRVYEADSVRVRLPQSVLRGQGSFGLASGGIIDAEATIESEDLGEVWPGIGEVSTRARADMRMTGTYRGFDVSGTLVAADLDYSAFRADSFAGDIVLTDVGGAFDMRADGTFYRAALAGIDADSAAVELEYAARRIAVSAELDMLEETSATLAGTIDFTGPETEVALTRLVYRTPEGVWAMSEGGRLAYAGGRVMFDGVQIAENGQRLRLDGEFGIAGESDLRFAAEDIDLQEVARLLGQPAGDWQGSVDVEGTLRGTRERPVIDMAGQVSSGTIRGFRFQRIAGSVRYADALADVDLTVATPTEDHRLVLTGTAPIDLALVSGVDRLPERPIDLHISGENTDLSLLGAVVPGLTDLAGPVDIRVDITGTSENPRFAGQATLQGGTLTIPATGVTYRDVRGRIAFDNDQISIEELVGTDGDRGSFEIGGRIEMENLRLGQLDFLLSATELQVMDLSRQDVRVHGSVAVTGTTDRPEITGRIIVDEAIYRMPERTDKDVIDLDEAVIYVDIPGEEGAARAAARSPSLWARSRVDLEIEVTDDAILTSNNMRVEIAGELSLFKPPASAIPTLSGTLQVRRGFYEEFGKRFTIEGGEVFFYGTPELNPGLHIVASRSVENVEGIGDVHVQITVGGTLSNPTIDLSSTPPFDKSEIIAIALFGTPTPSAGQQGQFSETVRELVTGTAAAPLEAALTSELNLDVLEISQRQESAGDTATLFRVGKFISPDVYLTFEQQVGGQEEHQAVGIRYQITEHFTVQATAGTRTSGVDLFWEYTY